MDLDDPNASPPPAGDATTLAVGALRWFHQGDTTGGFALYRQALRAPNANRLPVDRHIALLRGTQ